MEERVGQTFPFLPIPGVVAGPRREGAIILGGPPTTHERRPVSQDLSSVAFPLPLLAIVSQRWAIRILANGNTNRTNSRRSKQGSLGGESSEEGL